MKQPSPKTTTSKVKDQQLEEFEARDLGADIHASGVIPLVVRPKGTTDFDSVRVRLS